VPEFEARRTSVPPFSSPPELAAARLAVEWHGGSVDLLAAERGGCRLALALPYR